jgi:hypothetical protein
MIDRSRHARRPGSIDQFPSLASAAGTESPCTHLACGVLRSSVEGTPMTIRSSRPDVRPNRSRHVPEAIVRRLANDLALNVAWLLEPGVRGAWSESLARKVRSAGYPEIATSIERGTYEPPSREHRRPRTVLKGDRPANA